MAFVATSFRNVGTNFYGAGAPADYDSLKVGLPWRRCAAKRAEGGRNGGHTRTQISTSSLVCNPFSSYFFLNGNLSCQGRFHFLVENGLNREAVFGPEGQPLLEYVAAMEVSATFQGRLACTMKNSGLTEFYAGD